MGALASPVLRAAFERSRDGMLVIDDTGRYVDANAAACELLGRTRDEILRLSVYALSVEPPHALREMWQAFLATGSSAGEWRVQRPNGDVRTVHYTGIANIAPAQHLTILRDITDMRRAQDELRRSGDMFAKAFHATPMVLAVSALPAQICSSRSPFFTICPST